MTGTTRTTATVLTLGAALALAGCSSHSGSSATAPGTSASAPATSAQASPSASASASGSAAPSTGAASAASATTTSSAPSAPATVTSPGSSTTAAPTTSASRTATSASGSRCRNAQLRLSLGTEGAAAGNRYTPLVFTNTSSTPCTLSGHPGVSYVAGDKGVQVGASATRDPGTIKTVTLAAGGSASALIHEANYQNFEPSVCKPVTTRGFRVYPPGSKAAFFVPRPAKECSGTKLPGTALSIGVVKAGKNPSA